MIAPLTRRVLGWYEILSGAGGIVLVAIVLPQMVERVEAPHRIAIVLLYVAIGCVFVAVLLAGLLLLRDHRWGVLLSVLVQAAQIPLWAVGSSRWAFFSGAYLALLWQPDSPTILVGLKSSLELYWRGSQAATFFGINLVPIVVIYFLRKLTSVSASTATDRSPISLDHFA